MRTILKVSVAVALILVAPFLSFPVQQAEAADKFYTGPDGGLWSSPANWSGGTLPAGTDTIFIDGGAPESRTVFLDIDFQLDPTGSITISHNDELIIGLGVTLTNDGTINNNGGFGGVEVWGTLENSGTINNNSFLEIVGGTLENSGIVNNNLQIENQGTINNSGIDGTINNHANIANTQFGTMNNVRFINNEGSIDNDGIINNDGTIANDGSIHTEPNSALNNNNGGTININGAVQNFGNITNSGTINNFHMLDNHGNITNDDTINNYDTFNNFATGTIHNNGAINNKCGATFNNFGTYTGNPVNNESCIPSEGLLEISKAITLHQSGVNVDENVSNFVNIKIVEATLVNPAKGIHVYLDIPRNVPGFIQFNDAEWEPDVFLSDGKWELKLQIIAMYQDPGTNELKPIEQKIIIQFDIVDGILAVNGGELDLQKNIVLDPQPAQLNGSTEITIGEDVTPGKTGVFITEITVISPTGKVASYPVPIDITGGPTTVTYPDPSWVVMGGNGIGAIDEMGMWELDIEIVAFYEDGAMEIKRINQKLWISFNVIPESAIGTIALVASSLVGLGAFMRMRKNKSRSTDRTGADLGI